MGYKIQITNRIQSLTEQLLEVAKSAREYFTVKSKLSSYGCIGANKTGSEHNEMDADRMREMLGEIEYVIESPHIKTQVLNLTEQIRGAIRIQEIEQENSEHFASLLSRADEAFSSGRVGNGFLGERIFECVTDGSMPYDDYELVDIYKDADKKEREAMDKVMVNLIGCTMETLLMDAFKELERDETEREYKYENQ